MNRSAIFSGCRRYRYVLWRVWDDSRPWILVIGLNPSTADERHDDATSRVCIHYAQRWGYGGLALANLFAWCATKPAGLYRATDPVGPDNDSHLHRLIDGAEEVLCAWSDHGGYRDRDREVLRMIPHPQCLTHLKSGRPGHPLYKRRELRPVALRIAG
ncbi:DUF1643 domain-containing protein [Marinobacterium rhizophilum]|uniref:DUF1643 domain-containing protein n=1 Tax=Marinobacterium rhizophilum TaxID=420402 RepID=UPI0003783EE1|nr:DUF1643 domain-containing protein [Marinobacterium rhizophilum]